MLGKKLKLEKDAHKRLLKFYIVDIVAFGLNLLIYIIGTRYLGLTYYGAIILGTAVIILITYYAGRLWTFQETGVGHNEGLGRHILIACFMALVVIIFTSFFIIVLGLYDIAARVLGSIAAATISFILSSYITFEIPIFHRRDKQ
jgi:putative flippase GtrA